jgi:glycosyltransferase involved in cell wall biosynthesis
MIFFDVTKTRSAGHRSGLTRVSARLRESLGRHVTEVSWDAARRGFRTTAGAFVAQAGDWILTPELFSEEERPGFSEFLQNRPCRLAAIFHDAIPLKHPHITWPHSVARHPGYLKLLARFDRIWAVSRASRGELLGFRRWQGAASVPPVDVLALGADFNAQPRVTAAPVMDSRSLLCLGIIEPRKNQSFLLEVCDELWRDGVMFELHVIGRVNPHFGPPIVAKIKTLRRQHPRALHFHEAADDATLGRLYRSAWATVFPTIAEGCGLPLLESLWMGLPCVCSDLPVLRENAEGGGCVAAAVNDRSAWSAAIRGLVSDPTLRAKLAAEATSRPLPTWQGAAETLVDGLR